MSEISEAPIFDDAQLARLQTMVPDEDFRELLAVWMGAIERQMTSISTLSRAGDWPKPQREVHKLIGVAGSFGAYRLEQLGRQLQGACASAATADVETHLEATRTVALQTIAVMRARFQPSMPTGAQADGRQRGRSGMSR